MAKLSLFDRRRQRVRTSLRKRAGERARLSIHRSGRHIYAQVIDDTLGHTLVAASDLEEAVRDRAGDGATKVAKAKAVGQAIAERAKAAGVDAVVFDRGGFLYHGRVRAVADGAREGGLIF